MVTIKEIAKKCGVSSTAVSKALNNAPDISEATKHKIQKTAKEMGYFTNSAARNLRTGRSYMLGVLFYDRTQVGISHEYFSHILNCFKIQSETKGYGITFIGHKIGTQKMTYSEYAHAQNCDGIFIINLEFNDPEVIALSQCGIPLVTLDHVYNNVGAVLSDNETCMKKLVEYVYKMGHRKIAFIHGEMTSITQIRLASFYKTCKNLGITVPKEYVLPAYFHEPDSCIIPTEQLLRLKDRPTCILYPDDFTYFGGKKILESNGLSVPHDISVAGFDGLLLSQIISPKLTTVKQDTVTIGTSAANLLIEAIEESKTFIPRSIMVPGYVLEGESVADINGKVR